MEWTAAGIFGSSSNGLFSEFILGRGDDFFFVLDLDDFDVLLLFDDLLLVVLVLDDAFDDDVVSVLVVVDDCLGATVVSVVDPRASFAIDADAI